MAVILPAVGATWLMRHLRLQRDSLRIITPLASAASGHLGYNLYAISNGELRLSSMLDMERGC
jgi:hypothetical protein